MSYEGAVIIKIEDVTFYYESVKVLDGITIEVQRGEFLGLIGPNGSGKTTLLRCISGVLKPRVGVIYVDGQRIDKLKLIEVAQICASVPTELSSEFNLTVSDFVFLGRYPYVKGIWWESKEDEQIVEEVLKTFRIHHLADRKLSEISSGEKQRALLAKAVAQKPKVMLVDEPSAHLDLKYKLEVMEYLKELSRRKITIIAASHDVNLLSKYCDRIIILNSGKIVSFGRPEEVITEELIRKVYGVEATVMRNGNETFVVPKRPLR